jgi:hypothetical protein
MLFFYGIFKALPDSGNEHSVAARWSYVAVVAGAAASVVGSSWWLRGVSGGGVGARCDDGLGDFELSGGGGGSSEDGVVGGIEEEGGEDEDDDEEGDNAIVWKKGRPELSEIRGRRLVCGPESMKKACRGFECWEEVFEW